MFTFGHKLPIEGLVYHIDIQNPQCFPDSASLTNDVPNYSAEAGTFGWLPSGGAGVSSSVGFASPLCIRCTNTAGSPQNFGVYTATMSADMQVEECYYISYWARCSTSSLDLSVQVGNSGTVLKRNTIDTNWKKYESEFTKISATGSGLNNRIRFVTNFNPQNENWFDVDEVFVLRINKVNSLINNFTGSINNNIVLNYTSSAAESFGFNGIASTGSYLQLESTLPTGSYTKLAWIMRGADTNTPPVAFNNNNVMSSNGAVTNHGSVLWYPSSSNNYALQAGHNGNWTTVTGQQVPLNQWQLIGVTFDGLTLTLFQDGIKTAGPVYTELPSASTMYVSSFGVTPGSNGFSGSFSMGSLYNRPLNNKEIMSYFMATKGRFGK